MFNMTFPIFMNAIVAVSIIPQQKYLSKKISEQIHLIIILITYNINEIYTCVIIMIKIFVKCKCLSIYNQRYF